MLFRSWLGQLENFLRGAVVKKNPICFVTLANEKLLALVVLTPYNRRGSCWLLDLPLLLEPSKGLSELEVHQKIIQLSIDLGNIRTRSWLLRCFSNECKKISLARELGFQPLKYFQCWTPPKSTENTHSYASNGSLPEGVYWEKISKKTAPLLLHLEKAGASGHLRQIIDRQTGDILDQRKSSTGILLEKRGHSENALIGIVAHPETGLEVATLELLRDTVWDERIEEYLPIVLFNLVKSLGKIKIKTSQDDENLNQLLLKLGWDYSHEEILLGKTLLQRQSNRKITRGTKPLEKMLGRLQPQNPPLPTPTMGED